MIITRLKRKENNNNNNNSSFFLSFIHVVSRIAQKVADGFS